MPHIGLEKDNLAERIAEKIKAAIAFEGEHQFINAVGKSGDFASFVQSQAKEAQKKYKNNSHWLTIDNLMERYRFLDMSSRNLTCKKILRALDEILESKNLIQEKSNEVPEAIDPDLDISNLNIQFIKGIGPRLAEKLKKLGIETCEDLLHYLPRDHISYNESSRISELEIDSDVTILGVVKNITAFKSPKKNLVILTVVIQDDSGKIKIPKFFQGNSSHFYLKQYKTQLPIGSHVIAVGTVKPDKFSKQKVLNNAMVEIVSEEFSEDQDRSENIHTAKIVPIYPLTEGLSLMNLRRLIFHTLKSYKNNLKEFIPKQILEVNHLLGYKEAIKEVHFPESIEEKNNAIERLVFSEFFLMQLRFMQLRYEHRQNHEGIAFNCFENGLVDKFIASLPFKLTTAQKRVFFNEILVDMISKQPMHRLVQGDVGSGKTVVAFLAILVAIADGYQAAIMAPTEILAEQHYKKFCAWVKDMSEELNLRVGLLIGKQKTAEKRANMEGIASGAVNIAVGTHALIQDKVQFQNLGLVVIDEQHRFGVKQREALARKVDDNASHYLARQENVSDARHVKRREPEFTDVNEDSRSEHNAADDHFHRAKRAKTVEKLFMTATPIPRTLCLAMHGDLDLSEIDTMPEGRMPIITKLITKKAEAHSLIKDEIAKGNQAYIVFPLIEESETLSAQAATVEYEKLKEAKFKKYNIGLIHGRLKDDEKEQVMQDFRSGKLQILVSTTVIEVGVDVPNATVILIESAERFGLAQLHQLRGRVGRNDKQSYCLLTTNSKTDTTRERLSIMEKTNNGFVLAQEDLRIRGAGDLTGLKQSGVPESALQGLIDQEELLTLARRSADELIKANPDLSKHQILKERLERSAYAANYDAG